MTPAVRTIAFGAAFSDVLADLLVARAGDDPLALARTLVLLPSRRASSALTAAFVRRSEGGLLLPEMRGIADLDDGDELEDDGAPAIDAAERRLLLAGLLARGGTPPARALIEAAGLARALGELIGEDRRAADLAGAVEGDMARHWELTLTRLEAIARHWPAVLGQRGLVDPETRRARAARALAATWAAGAGRPVVAAGFASAPPFAAELIRAVARLPDGLVVLPGLDLAMDDAAWDALDPADPAMAAHPQAGLKLLLDAIGVARGEVEAVGEAAPGPALRVAAAARALAPSAFAAPPTPADHAALGDIRLIEAADAGEEAQAIALAMRHALETPGLTAALVTPDRGLARRVAAHLARWGVEADDSAGVPLAATPPGAFLALLAAAAAARFASGATLALLDHPYAGGEARDVWRRHARALDLAMRERPPRPGLRGLGERVPDEASGWWSEVSAALMPLAQAGAAPLPERVTALIAAAGAIAGEAPWRGVDGRALADALAPLVEHGGALPALDWTETAAVVDAALAEAVARRPGAHPRLAILGLLEARLQRADLVILGGLNDGVWPAPPAPDPWLPPIVRRRLGLPTPERRLGLAAHDFLGALGAERVLLTRARRDASAPTVASRFLLRLDAMAGGLERETTYLALARALDAPGAAPRPAVRPAPRPPVAMRPRRLRVTEADLLAADPFAFHAKRVLGLARLRAIDEEPGAAERGVFLHEVMERWRGAGGDPAELPTFARRRFDGRWGDQPLLAVTWRPRFVRAMAWAAERLDADRAAGRSIVAVEATGGLELRGIAIEGRADRVDDTPDGLVVVDYKSGGPPTRDQHKQGFALQLGLLAWMARAGALGGVPAAPVAGLAYWQLGGGNDPGEVCDPLREAKGAWTEPAAFIDATVARTAALADAFLTGDAPFEAKRKPEFARQTDYDQLARLDEWLGR